MSKRRRGQINEEIIALFAANGVVQDGPGEEAFWNAVEDLEEVNKEAAERMHELSDEWIAAEF